jgi:branched-subunit amino acid transport protein
MNAVLVAGLAAATILLKGLAPGLREVPPALVRRTAGLAPALLAALVITQLASTTQHGFTPDIRLAAVAVAAMLASVRAPLLVCVIAGAAVAALWRLFTGAG